MLEKSKGGFTLVEIIIVMIILGVISTFSFPAFFSQIKRQQGQEAMNTMSMMRSNMETCGVSNNYDFTQCETWDSLSMEDPSNTAGRAGSKFDYVWSDWGSNTYTMTATDHTDANNWIKQTRTSASGMTCTDHGAFQGFC